MMNPLRIKLETRGVSKSFPGVNALQDVDFRLLEGEVHVLCGENGAGKSTLMHILSGNLQPDKGSISLNTEEIVIETPREALKKGIAIVYQERSLTEELSVAENIFANRQPRNKMGFIAFRQMNKRTLELLNTLSLKNISPVTKIKYLSAAQKQMIEIAKALSTQPSILILDEPTASITETETQLLFSIIRRLSSEGVSIIYISHRMKEIFEIGDRITVLKDGQVQGTFPVADMSEDLLIKKMTGRHLTTHVTSTKAQQSIALEVKKFSGNGFSDVNFQLYKGEILVLAGLVGAGRTEIARALFGVDPVYNGDYFIGEQPASINHPGDAIKKGVAYIPEERKDKGLFMQMTMEENMLSGSIAIRDRQRLHPGNKRSAVTDMIRRLNISPALPDRKVIALSGGNQQKTVLAKWLLLNPQIIIADEPTHGIDVGAKFEIYQILQTLAKNGASILLISSELPEVLTLAHRILVIYNGKITAALSREDATEENIMRYASGIENMYIDL